MRMADSGRPSTAASLLICLSFIICCAAAFSLDRDRNISQFYTTFWSEKDGAPSEISALAQTADGFLWIGSPRGLFRFDGVKFEEYKPQLGIELPSHSVYSLMATPDGGLWIAFEPSGLGFLKDGVLTVYKNPPELPDSPVHCFAHDLDGRIWAGTETGLALREGSRWISVGRDWNFPPEMIRYVLTDRDGTVWVATVSKVVFLKRGSKRFEFGGSVGTGVTRLAQSRDGRVWLSDDGGFQVRPVPTPGRNANDRGPTIAEDGLRDLLFDRDGALWMTRLASGLVRVRHPEQLKDRSYGLRDPELESFGAGEGFAGGFAYVLLEDREGDIWVGCSNGLMRFRHNQVVPVNLGKRYQKMTLAAGKAGDLWVGAINGGAMLHLQGESIVPDKVSERIASVVHGSNGDILWGSRDGVWRQRDSEFKNYPLPKNAVHDWMYDMMPGKADDELWVKLGDVGFVHFEQGTWNLSEWPKGVPSTGDFHFGTSASYRDPSGRYWLGYTSGQICELDGEKATVYSQKDGLDLGRIKVIRGLGQQVWVGGELGLMSFIHGRFVRVGGVDGELFGAISGIIVTREGGLWLNEMKGIVAISTDEIRQFLADPSYRVRYRRFDYQDGLPGSPQMSFTSSTTAETSDGRLWFATDNGLARIDPKSLVKNLVPPPVSILSIGSENGPVPKSSLVRFSAGTRTVEIDYAGLSLSIPERVEFRYKLAGVDTAWQAVGTRRQAYYSNLGPGSYRFQVIACNNDGVWNDTGASIEFSIAPAYYQTMWFRMACVAIFAALLLGAYQIRMSGLRRHSQQLVAMNTNLEGQIRERERAEQALSEAQMELARVNRVMLVGETAASIAHEVNQPIAATLTNARTGLRWLAAQPPEPRHHFDTLRAQNLRYPGIDPLRLTQCKHTPADAGLVR